MLDYGPAGADTLFQVPGNRRLYHQQTVSEGHLTLRKIT